MYPKILVKSNHHIWKHPSTYSSIVSGTSGTRLWMNSMWIVCICVIRNRNTNDPSSAETEPPPGVGLREPTLETNACIGMLTSLPVRHASSVSRLSRYSITFSFGLNCPSEFRPNRWIASVTFRIDVCRCIYSIRTLIFVSIFSICTSIFASITRRENGRVREIFVNELPKEVSKSGAIRKLEELGGCRKMQQDEYL